MSIILIRSVILYLLVVFAVRLMGKRQLGELQPSELVITILVSNIATLPLEDPDIPVIVGVTPILSLVCCEVIVSQLILRSQRLRRLISGSPKVMISNGCINIDIMRELRFSVDDLMTALRAKDVFSPEDVQYAVVETNGSVSVLLKSDSGGSDPPPMIISDGVVQEKAAQDCGLTAKGIERILKNNGIRSPESVLFLAADSSGNGFMADKKSGRMVRLEGKK
ncbi:MAG: DUF421 domain-containing protein [Ruminococcus sp.]|nr:DUF421 domain-containing protein [Ruminococcus sp.]